MKYLGHEWLQTTELAQSATPLDSFRQVVRCADSLTVAQSPLVQKPGALFQLFDLATHLGVLFVKRIGKQERRPSSGWFFRCWSLFLCFQNRRLGHFTFHFVLILPNTFKFGIQEREMWAYAIKTCAIYQRDLHLVQIPGTFLSKLAAFLLVLLLCAAF